MNKELQAVSRLYLDTNIFIYFLEANETFTEAVCHVFEACEEYNITAITSEITIAECLISPYRNNATALVEQYEAFFRSAEGAIGIVPVESSILMDAPAIAGTHRLKLVDSIHVATAMAAGCDRFLTNDKGIGSLGKNLPTLYLSDLMET